MEESYRVNRQRVEERVLQSKQADCKGESCRVNRQRVKERESCKVNRQTVQGRELQSKQADGGRKRAAE